MMKRIISISLFLLLFCVTSFTQKTIAKVEKSACSKIELHSPPTSVRSGEIVTFTITVFGDANEKSSNIKWSVDKGSIINGQGTSSIGVSTNGLYGEVLTATVNVDRGKDCKLYATGTAEIQGGHASLFDEFEDIDEKEITRRFKLFTKQIDESAMRGYIINYGIKADVEKRVKLFRKLIADNIFSKEKIEFVFGGESKVVNTRFWLMPNGCPSVSITSPAITIDVNEKTKFNLNIFGGEYDADKIKINWTIEGATIISGQGTKTLELLTNKKYQGGLLVKATAKVSGLPKKCKDLEISETIACPHCGGIGTTPILIDEFGGVTSGDIRARLDAFILELQNSEGSQGYVVNYGTARQVARRERIIRRHLDFRDYPLSNITFIKGGAEKTIRTKFWRVPPGADASEID